MNFVALVVVVVDVADDVEDVRLVLLSLSLMEDDRIDPDDFFEGRTGRSDESEDESEIASTEELSLDGPPFIVTEDLTEERSVRSERDRCTRLGTSLTRLPISSRLKE